MGCDTIHAAGDADFLIGQSAVSVSATRDTVVIADDTDILILLCHQGNNSKKKIFFKPQPLQASSISERVAGMWFHVTVV